MFRALIILLVSILSFSCSTVSEEIPIVTSAITSESVDTTNFASSFVYDITGSDNSIVDKVETTVVDNFIDSISLNSKDKSNSDIIPSTPADNIQPEKDEINEVANYVENKKVSTWVDKAIADYSKIDASISNKLDLIFKAYNVEATEILYNFDWNSIRKASYLSNGNIFFGRDAVQFGVIPDGDGLVSFKNGNVFIGQFTNSARNGSGVMLWTNGAGYFGQWKNNAFEGKGVYFVSDNDIWYGLFKNGILYDGVNCIKHENGNIYYYDYSKGQQTGHIMIMFASGELYTGSFTNQQLTGNGTMYYTNGDKYVGDIVDGKKSGSGVYTFKDGRSVKGTWVSDKYTE